LFSISALVADPSAASTVRYRCRARPRGFHEPPVARAWEPHLDQIRWDTFVAGSAWWNSSRSVLPQSWQAPPSAAMPLARRAAIHLRWYWSCFAMSAYGMRQYEDVRKEKELIRSSDGLRHLSYIYYCQQHCAELQPTSIRWFCTPKSRKNLRANQRV